MKVCYLAFYLILFTSIGNAQNFEWNEYETDSIVRVALPGNAFEVDTLLNRQKFYQLYSVIDSTSYILQRTGLKVEGDNVSANIPYDKESLEKAYNGAIIGIKRNQTFIPSNEGEFIVEEYSGRFIDFVDSKGQNVYSVRYLVLNSDLYTLMYRSEFNFNEADKARFFNSLNINNGVDITQFAGKSKAFQIGHLVGNSGFFFFLAFIAAIFIIWLIIKIRKNNREDSMLS